MLVLMMFIFSTTTKTNEKAETDFKLIAKTNADKLTEY